MRADPFPRFVARRLHEKRDTTKSHREVIFHPEISPICGEFPTQPNLTKTGVRVVVADVIDRTKFGDDRSREYKVTEDRILACSMACRL